MSHYCVRALRVDVPNRIPILQPFPASKPVLHGLEYFCLTLICVQVADST